MPQPKTSANDNLIESLLDQAKALDDEKTALYERIGANRELLRNLDKTGMLSAEQSKEVNDFYPPVQRKPKTGTAA